MIAMVPGSKWSAWLVFGLWTSSFFKWDHNRKEAMIQQNILECFSEDCFSLITHFVQLPAGITKLESKAMHH